MEKNNTGNPKGTWVNAQLYKNSGIGGLLKGRHMKETVQKEVLYIKLPAVINR